MPCANVGHRRAALRQSADSQPAPASYAPGSAHAGRGQDSRVARRGEEVCWASRALLDPTMVEAMGVRAALAGTVALVVPDGVKRGATPTADANGWLSGALQLIRPYPLATVRTLHHPTSLASRRRTHQTRTGRHHHQSAYVVIAPHASLRLPARLPCRYPCPPRPRAP